MAACRCSTCGINYPDRFLVDCARCAVCDGPTSRFSSLDPDSDWAKRAEQLIEQRDGVPPDDELIPVVTANVRVEHGQLWVLAWDVFNTVRRRLREHDLFRIGQQTFEVLGYVDDRREYLVRPFSMELSEDELRKLADGVR